MFGLETGNREFTGAGLGGGLSDTFSGHFFQDAARGDGAIMESFAKVLDCQMSMHKLDADIHLQRVAELREIEQRVKERQPKK